MYSESGLVPSSSLFQNHVLTDATSFEEYVSDVIERRLETGRRSESYICKIKHIYIVLVFLTKPVFKP
jgi:uncharacterized membrane protein